MRNRALKKVDSVAPSGARSAVLYARVSSKEQEQGYSIPAQQELLRRYANQMGMTTAQEFVDIESAKSMAVRALPPWWNICGATGPAA
jgi:predicted site-specific integrase-resolvase